MLYIMRHGKTEWNAMHKLQGRMDIPLNEEGREMAEKAREEYKNLNIDICYCSPLVRAKETAEIVLRGRNIPILTDDRLVEMSFGEYEGWKIVFTFQIAPLMFFIRTRRNIQNPSEERRHFRSYLQEPESF